MDKKDIYEHLAKIYLDASSKNKKKTESPLKFFKKHFFIGIVIVSVGSIILFLVTSRNESLSYNLSKKKVNHELALILQTDIVKINFNFDPAQEEIYSINLNKLNLARFRALGFSIRKANYEDNIVLKLEFTNAVNERSEIYLNGMPSYKWLDCRIDLDGFKNISDWSEMLNLSFIVERRNTNNKKGIVYIDNIRLLK